MDINKLQKQLEIDEGLKHKIYKDHLGNPTFGIGHLVIPSDPEHSNPIGTQVSPERVQDAFRKDVDNAVKDCKSVFGSSWANLHGEAQEVFTNMAFNMGQPRLKSFKKMINAAQEGDWKEAAKEGRDSKWWKQVPDRAERLMKQLENIETK